MVASRVVIERIGLDITKFVIDMHEMVKESILKLKIR